MDHASRRPCLQFPALGRFTIVGLFVQRVGVHFQQHAELLRRAMAATSDMRRKPPLLVLHETSSGSTFNHQLGETGGNVVWRIRKKRKSFVSHPVIQNKSRSCARKFPFRKSRTGKDNMQRSATSRAALFEKGITVRHDKVLNKTLLNVGLDLRIALRNHMKGKRTVSIS